jgi:type IV secretory pathway TraG/TraD family ATPase VirD4
MPSEITQLPDLHAYLKLPGDWPVTTLTFNYRDRPVLNPAFVEQRQREEGGDNTSRDVPFLKENQASQCPNQKISRLFQLREHLFE